MAGFKGMNFKSIFATTRKKSPAGGSNESLGVPGAGLVDDVELTPSTPKKEDKKTEQVNGILGMSGKGASFMMY